MGEIERSLDALYDAEGDDEEEAADGGQARQWQARLNELRSQLRRLTEKYATWTPDILAVAGVCDLLALCTALTLNAVAAGSGQHPADDLAAACDLDMADWWEPTAANYLRQVPKALILDAVVEAVSAEAAAPLEKLKKDELVARAEALMAGKGWLPTVLRPRMEPATPGRTSLKVVASMGA